MGDSTIAHIVWDWNGTLLDDGELVIAATNASFAAAGHPPVTAEQYRTLFTRPLRLFYGALLDRPVSEPEAADLDAAFHSEYAGLVVQAGLRNEATDALEQARRRGLGQSLLSMWPHEFLVPLVDRLGLASYFSRVDGNRSPTAAGKTQALHEHLEVLGRSAQSVLMIGDSHDDGVAARDVGCRCVLIDSGHTTVESLEETGWPVAADLVAALESALAQ